MGGRKAGRFTTKSKREFFRSLLEKETSERSADCKLFRRRWDKTRDAVRAVPHRVIANAKPDLAPRTNPAIRNSIRHPLFIWSESLRAFILWRRLPFCFISMSAKSAHEVPETLENRDLAVPRRRRTGGHYRERR